MSLISPHASNQLSYKNQCSGGVPCDKCVANSQPKLWIVPCVKADFFEMVESGPFFICELLPFMF